MGLQQAPSEGQGKTAVPLVAELTEQPSVSSVVSVLCE